MRLFCLLSRRLDADVPTETVRPAFLNLDRSVATVTATTAAASSITSNAVRDLRTTMLDQNHRVARRRYSDTAGVKVTYSDTKRQWVSYDTAAASSTRTTTTSPHIGTSARNLPPTRSSQATAPVVVGVAKHKDPLRITEFLSGPSEDEARANEDRGGNGISSSDHTAMNRLIMEKFCEVMKSKKFEILTSLDAPDPTTTTTLPVGNRGAVLESETNADDPLKDWSRRDKRWSLAAAEVVRENHQTSAQNNATDPHLAEGNYRKRLGSCHSSFADGGPCGGRQYHRQSIPSGNVGPESIARGEWTKGGSDGRTGGTANNTNGECCKITISSSTATTSSNPKIYSAADRVRRDGSGRPARLQHEMRDDSGYRSLEAQQLQGAGSQRQATVESFDRPVQRPRSQSLHQTSTDRGGEGGGVGIASSRGLLTNLVGVFDRTRSQAERYITDAFGQAERVFIAGRPSSSARSPTVAVVESLPSEFVGVAHHQNINRRFSCDYYPSSSQSATSPNSRDAAGFDDRMANGNDFKAAKRQSADGGAMKTAAQRRLEYRRYRRQNDKVHERNPGDRSHPYATTNIRPSFRQYGEPETSGGKQMQREHERTAKHVGQRHLANATKNRFDGGAEPTPGVDRSEGNAMPPSPRRQLPHLPSANGCRQLQRLLPRQQTLPVPEMKDLVGQINYKRKMSLPHTNNRHEYS